MEKKRANNKSNAQKKAEKAVKAFHSPDTIRQDPSGSYSGYPKDRGNVPEQDADDL
ncbi:MAG: hypothetical protein ABF449_12635 [Ethanoligenens sp.]